MEGVSNHDRTIGEDGFAIRGRGAGRKERPNTKRTGELAEASFLHKAVGLGLNGTAKAVPFHNLLKDAPPLADTDPWMYPNK